MKIILLSFLLFISAASSARPSGWAERPDREFHTHPLIEMGVTEREYARGKIEEILRPATHSESGLVRVLVVSGPYSREYMYARNFLRPAPSSVREKRGESVVISYIDGDGPREALVEDADRTGALLILCLIFIFLVLAVCRKKGIRSLGALAVSILAVRFVFIPSVIRGYSPLTWAVFTSFLMIIVTMIAIGGTGPKSRAAIFGSLGGVGVSLLLCAAFFSLSGISGFFMEEVQLLNYVLEESYGVSFFREFLMALVILGASGVIMDAAISVASSLDELKLSHPTLSRQSLYSSGKAVGGDVSSVMINTLIMAYIGGMLGVILVYRLRVGSWVQLSNLPFFHFEIYRAILGAGGFCAAVWLTVWGASRLMDGSR